MNQRKPLVFFKKAAESSGENDHGPLTDEEFNKWVTSAFGKFIRDNGSPKNGKDNRRENANM